MGDFLGDILEGTEWSDLSKKRLAQYMYVLQRPMATPADICIVWAYLDALADNRLITQSQKVDLVCMAKVLHERKITDRAPYQKYTRRALVETIDQIAKGERHEKTGLEQTAQV